MAVLGKNRLEMDRDDFLRWSSSKSPNTQARYVRAYNKYQKERYAEKGTPSSTMGTRRSVRYEPERPSYQKDPEGLAVVTRQGGNRYAVVAEVKYKIDGKTHTAAFSVHKGNQRLDDADIEQITAGMKDRYKLEGVVEISTLQVVDRLNRVRVPYDSFRLKQ